ncbi:hypothetical protein CBL_12811 [Carabus blaptoides fortunei]
MNRCKTCSSRWIFNPRNIDESDDEENKGVEQRCEMEDFKSALQMVRDIIKRLLEVLSFRIKERRNQNLVSLAKFLQTLDLQSTTTEDFPSSTKTAIIRYANNLYIRLFEKKVESVECEEIGMTIDTDDTSPENILEVTTIKYKFAEAISASLKKVETNTSGNPTKSLQKEFQIYENTGNITSNLQKLLDAVMTIQLTSIESERVTSASSNFSQFSNATLSRKAKPLPLHAPRRSPRLRTTTEGTKNKMADQSSVTMSAEQFQQLKQGMQEAFRSQIGDSRSNTHASTTSTSAANEDVFAQEGEPTPYAEHRFDTGDHPPISVPLNRLPVRKKEVLRDEVEKMLADAVIEECESPWAAPVVLVPKSTTELCSLTALSEIFKDVETKQNARHYNLRRRPLAFKVGDSVCKRNYVLSDASKYFSAKLTPRYIKCTVYKKISPLTYRLRDWDNKDLGVWHIKDLKQDPDDDEAMDNP